MNGEKIVEKIPDVHFDWYARLIPGSIAVALYFILSKAPYTIDGWHLFLYAAWAYALGHLAQPLASCVVKLIQKAIGTDEEKYERATQIRELKPRTLNVSKAYAETVGMLSTFILISAALIIVNYQVKIESIAYSILIYLLFATMERVFARKKKISELAVKDDT